MDKKNTTIGVLLLLAAIASLLISQRFAPPPPPAPPPAIADESSRTRGTAATPGEILPPTTLQPATVSPSAPDSGASTMFAATVDRRSDEQLISLGNEFVDFRFTNYGGAVAEVALKKYQATKDGDDPYVLNSHRVAPALALMGFPGADNNTPYTLVSQSSRSIVWRATVGGQLEITRTYTLNAHHEEGDPYLLQHETTFRNLLDGPLNTAKLAISLGTAEPVDAKDPGNYLNVGVYDAEDADFIGRSNFEPGFFARNFKGDSEIKFSIPRVQPTVWASVKNQFFTAVLTPDRPGTGVTARRVELPLIAGEARPRVAITANMQLDPVQLAPGGSETLKFSYFAGPKEYDRLVRLGQNQDAIMEFGFFHFFSKLLLYLLKFLHGYVGNWGVAIVGTTLILRTLMWPLTASAAKSAKRMGKIQGPMKEIQEKYKDNKQKQQEAMLALFKEHKVNPVGGCLPLFLQIPIFFGLFRMLQSASELRYAEFLWVKDLSQADTVAHIFGLPLNIMPLLMGASMVVQMRMTPTPTVDNPSAKMMKFMPYFVTIMCYTFSSGLAVYWTASNLFSIFQQWVTNRSKDPVVIAPPAKPGAAERAKPVRDAKVTHSGPRKKKR